MTLPHTRTAARSTPSDIFLVIAGRQLMNCILGSHTAQITDKVGVSASLSRMPSRRAIACSSNSLMKAVLYSQIFLYSAWLGDSRFRA